MSYDEQVDGPIERLQEHGEKHGSCKTDERSYDLSLGKIHCASHDGTSDALSWKQQKSRIRHGHRSLLPYPACHLRRIKKETNDLPPCKQSVRYCTHV